MERPELEEEKRRKVQVNIRLTDAEHQKVLAFAQG